MSTQFTLAGNAEDVDLVAFRQSLLAQMQSANPDVEDVIVSIAAGSVLLDVSIIANNAAAVNAVTTELTTTSASEMANEWFGGSVTVNSVASPTVASEMISAPPPSLPPPDDGVVAPTLIGLGVAIVAIVLVAILLKGKKLCRKRSRDAVSPARKHVQT